MLRQNIKQHLRHEKALRDENPTKPMSGSQRALYHRAKKDALRGIEDLTFLLETLQEKQLEEIFTEKTMKPFFDALLSLESDDKEKRLKRVKLLWRLLLMRSDSYAINLVGRDTWKAITGRTGSSVRAIYYAAVHE